MPARFAGGAEECTLPKVGRKARNNSGIASHVPGQPSACGPRASSVKKLRQKAKTTLPGRSNWHIV
jgi:hypothetical protein